MRVAAASVLPESVLQPSRALSPSGGPSALGSPTSTTPTQPQPLSAQRLPTSTGACPTHLL